MTTISTIFERFLRTDEGQKIEQEIETEKLSARQELVEEKTRLTAAAEKEFPRLAKAKAAALQARNSARENLRACEIELSRATQAAYGASHKLSTQVGRCDRELLESVDPRIEESRQKWFAEVERIRQSGLRCWEESTGKFSGRFGDAETIARSNRGELLAAMNRVTLACEKLEELKFTCPPNVELAISEITDGLPTLSDFTA